MSGDNDEGKEEEGWRALRGISSLTAVATCRCWTKAGDVTTTNDSDNKHETLQQRRSLCQAVCCVFMFSLIPNEFRQRDDKFGFGSIVL